MNRLVLWTCSLLLAVPAARASLHVEEDASGETALLTWKDPVPWQAGLIYQRLSRPVELDGTERDFKAHVAEAMVGVSPWPWLLLFGQAGASEARLEGSMSASADAGAGGLLGARLNAWQIHQGAHRTAWRLTLQVAGQYAYRTSADDGEGELRWQETLLMLPLDYHLSFARTFRNTYAGEFQSLHVYVGPAYSKLDGTWSRDGLDRDFEEAEAFGAVGGGELWLLENLAFGARFDWFEGTSGQITVRYRF
ncbi:MAG TPA: hypothetical protein P5204_09180 [Kiritimatiellia bacterium]|nr:hypothetical protein [Kiritimatiellia bacterium]